MKKNIFVEGKVDQVFRVRSWYGHSHRLIAVREGDHLYYLKFVKNKSFDNLHLIKDLYEGDKVKAHVEINCYPAKQYQITELNVLEFEVTENEGYKKNERMKENIKEFKEDRAAGRHLKHTGY